MFSGSRDQNVVRYPLVMWFGSRDSQSVRFGSRDHEPVQSQMICVESLEIPEDVSILQPLPGLLAKGLYYAQRFQVDTRRFHVELGEHSG